MKHHRPPTPPGRAEILAELRRQLAKTGRRGPVKLSVGLVRAILEELEEPAPAGAAGGSTEEEQAMRMLETGDPCPCCGQPILSEDPAVLALLTRIATGRRLLTVEEIQALRKEKSDGGHGRAEGGCRHETDTF